MELCRGFGLPHSGNMTMLRERLKEFSGSREEWNRYVYPPFRFLMFRPLPSSPMHRLVVNARNAHLGPRNGRNTTSKSQKKSAQRREMMFENSEAAPPADPFPSRRLPTIPSTAVPEKCHAKHAAILQWVRQYHSLPSSHLSD